MRITQKCTGIVRLIGGAGSVERIALKVIRHSVGIESNFFAISICVWRQEQHHELQQVTGQKTVVAFHQQPTDGILLQNFIRLGRQFFRKHRLMDKQRIFTEHLGHAVFPTFLVNILARQFVREIRKAILFIGTKIIVGQFRLFGKPSPAVFLRAVIPSVGQIRGTKLLRTNGNGVQELIV